MDELYQIGLEKGILEEKEDEGLILEEGPELIIEEDPNIEE